MDRFIRRVDRSGGPEACWPWGGGKIRTGYGHLKVKGRTVLAHRVAYEVWAGPIPEGKHVLHNCPGGDNPACCNPAHLWLGTQADNMKDMSRKGRVRGAAALKGEAHHSARINDAAARELIRMYAGGGHTFRQLGALFGISRQQAHRIVRGQRRRQLQ